MPTWRLKLLWRGKRGQIPSFDITISKNATDKWRQVCQVNISVIFSGKPIGFEKFLNQMVVALGIVI